MFAEMNFLCYSHTRWIFKVSQSCRFLFIFEETVKFGNREIFKINESQYKTFTTHLSMSLSIELPLSIISSSGQQTKYYSYLHNSAKSKLML